MILLGIETSCDETSVCLLKNGREILSLLTNSQILFHEKYGGIVPEVASRQHAETLLPLLHEMLQECRITLDDIDAVAVTCGPGLEGALLVGVGFAKTLSFAKGIPLIGINHLEGHIYSNFLHGNGGGKNIRPPFLALIASGGHSEIVLVQAHGNHKIIGETMDDAAGECLDKIARALGIGFPGGPVIEKLAKKGNPEAIHFPRATLRGKPYHFSFSGLKTSVLRWIEKNADNNPSSLPSDKLHDLCASFQEAVVDALAQKTLQAAVKLKIKTILAGGGVVVNARLREKMSALAAEHHLTIIFPEVKFCSDNAAMIACAGYIRWKNKQFSPLELTVYPQLRLDADASALSIHKNS